MKIMLGTSICKQIQVTCVKYDKPTIPMGVKTNQTLFLCENHSRHNKTGLKNEDMRLDKMNNINLNKN